MPQPSSGQPGNSGDPPAVPFSVVGVGASAGGLEACGNLLDALPSETGMAFILIQHLDPSHESMMAELLATHTEMRVSQAVDGMPIERDNVYMIPPGTSLSVTAGTLHLSQPVARHGARMPFDFLLESLANAYGPRAMGVVLSGTGSDGSIGMRALKEKGGFVIAQDPSEAGYDGMPRSAILTGVVDRVLRVADIATALLEHDRDLNAMPEQVPPPQQAGPPEAIARIIDLVRSRTTHDFRLYKPGTLQRRIERRMTMADMKTNEFDRYHSLLLDDRAELASLAEDLLINVTDFFRDPNVYETLAERIIPPLVQSQPPGQPIRIWVAGCSTGEEAYSLAILFLEHITQSGRDVRVQIFASDADPDAVARAREGAYPTTIETTVSPARLARFFERETDRYRASDELRSVIIFTIHDLLVDPPFSRLDMVSCRNLLIYLRPEAQAKVLSLFHFALRDGGILLLGGSETVGTFETQFSVVAKAERLYRHVGHGPTEERRFPIGSSDITRLSTRVGQGPGPRRLPALTDLCQRLVLDTYAPAAILINRNRECLYTIGATDRYLRVPSGLPTHDILSMAREGLRGRLRMAIEQVEGTRTRVIVPADDLLDRTAAGSFNIDIHPVSHEGDDLLLVCFIDQPPPAQSPSCPVKPEETSRLVDLEQELTTTREALQNTVRDLEASAQAQRASNQEASSIAEEYQSTNEELVTSKEELQSLNEELTALNSQLQETLDRQRTTSNDLQNVLHSTDVAILFLDAALRIRFFTPATRSLFSIIPGDIGRPLGDLKSRASDDMLLGDAQTVMSTLLPIERETQAQDGAWFLRRTLPYRTQDGLIEGVVITFSDITERRRISAALEQVRLDAERANLAKSRFLAAASHDLRQPLQTLVLIQGLLSKTVKTEQAQKLIKRLDETLGTMGAMLNTILDINQIEAGNVRAEMVDFEINDMLERIRVDFLDQAIAKGIALRVVPCKLPVHSDPRLLEQVLRNLVSNAIKYTERGKVLLGCRRRNGMLSVEVCDTGIGIPQQEMQAIFDEYYQIDNVARKRERGLGLGLSIAQRLGKLLGHPIRVASKVGKGSVFSISVLLPTRLPVPAQATVPAIVVPPSVATGRRQGSILVIEDDRGMRDLVEALLTDEGHHVVAVPDGAEALALVSNGTYDPDLILSDYNLPDGPNGAETALELRRALHRSVPVIILTGDISTATLRELAGHGFRHLNKPVRPGEITDAIDALLPPMEPMPPPAVVDAVPVKARLDSPMVFVIDDDPTICRELQDVLEQAGYAVEAYPDCESFLAGYAPVREGCILIDAYLPGMSGLELLQHIHDAGRFPPAIMITGHAEVSIAVRAMKAGAFDFIEKPVTPTALLESLSRALEQSHDASKLQSWHETAVTHLRTLTKRQHEIMKMVLAGHPSKNIAADLGISQRTVENHRAAIMRKTGSKSLPALARLALAARLEVDY